MTSPSPAPLTEAERLAYVEIYGGAHNTDHSMLGLKPGATCKRCESTARAVVASVKPQIAAEALREAAKYLYEHRRDNDGAFDLWQMYEAGGPEWLSSRANAALSLPASKETPDA